MADDPVESLTPYTDALRDLTNISASFEVFTKIGPILKRVADVEAAIPQAKQTLDRIAAALDLATEELAGVTERTAQARVAHDQAVAAMASRAADKHAALVGATRKAQSEYEAEVARIAAGVAEAVAEGDAKLAGMKTFELAQQGALDRLTVQVDAAQRQLASVRDLVGR